MRRFEFVEIFRFSDDEVWFVYRYEGKYQPPVLVRASMPAEPGEEPVVAMLRPLDLGDGERAWLIEDATRRVAELVGI